MSGKAVAAVGGSDAVVEAQRQQQGVLLPHLNRQTESILVTVAVGIAEQQRPLVLLAGREAAERRMRGRRGNRKRTSLVLEDDHRRIAEDDVQAGRHLAAVVVETGAQRGYGFVGLGTGQLEDTALAPGQLHSKEKR